MGLGLIDREIGVFERAAASEIAGLLGGDKKSVRLRAVPDGLLGGAFGVLREGKIEASHFETDELPLYTEPWRSQHGVLKSLKLRLKNFRLRSLEIESLEADVPACRYDFALLMREKRVRISRSGVGIGKVRVRETALSDFVLRKFSGMKSISIRCDRGWIWAEGEGEFLVIQTKFWLKAKLVPRGGRQLFLEQATVSFDGIRAEPELAKVLLDALNPVVDLDADLGLHGAMDVEAVEAANGTVTAIGKSRIPVAPGGITRGK